MLEDKNTQHIISFSGGKDSTAMLFLMLEKGMRIDRIISVDTTKEFPAMYDHIRKVQSMIDIPIEIVKIPFDYWFGEHVKTRGKNKGKKGYGWPTPLGRWCTALKREAVNKLLKGTNPIIYTGIAADEAHRAQRNGGIHATPLIDMGITEKDALAYCKSLGFDWGGLYDEGYNRVSCYCCPLQRLGSLKLTYMNHPDLWQNMRDMDAISPYPFRKNYTLEQLEERFKKELSSK